MPSDAFQTPSLVIRPQKGKDENENALDNKPRARRRMACEPFLNRPLHTYFPVPQLVTSGKVASQRAHSITWGENAKTEWNGRWRDSWRRWRCWRWRREKVKGAVHIVIASEGYRPRPIRRKRRFHASGVIQPPQAYKSNVKNEAKEVRFIWVDNSRFGAKLAEVL